MATNRAPRVPLRHFVRLALVLGITGFGGGFAVAQQIRAEVVNRRQWMRDATFMEHLAVASALPGTAATNLLAILGYRLGGVWGAACGAVGFLAPSVALMVAFGAVYDRLRGVHALATFFDGMALATVGVIAGVALDMGRASLRRPLHWIIAGLATIALALRWLNLLEVIALAGIAGALAFRPEEPRRTSIRDSFPPGSMRAVLPLPLVSAFPLFTVFARISIATFGGGFAMIAPIEHEVVVTRHWLDSAAFADAMVFGQITPGPVAIAATFIGYRVAGPIGALMATLGMFAPPFFMSIAVAKSIESFRANPAVQGFLAGVAPAVVGVIATAAISLGRTAVHDASGAAMVCGAFVLLAWRPGLSPMVPLFFAGALRTAISLLR